jgi:DNA polymerase-3 subunit epsilon
MRQIVLDTETTGLEVSQDHRIIEIGCVELINRKLTGKRYHQYINPTRKIDEGAIAVHGITNEFLDDKPTFEAISRGFLEFLNDSELVIHNAPFDISFLNHELSKLSSDIRPLDLSHEITDTLMLAKQKHPGQRNNLDALCKRYNVDNSQRDFHGALLDAEILADIYLLMSGGQVSLDIGATVLAKTDDLHDLGSRDQDYERTSTLRVIRASEDEVRLHMKRLRSIEQEAGYCIWLQKDNH